MKGRSVVMSSSGGEMDLLSSNISDERTMANPERELERKMLGSRSRKRWGA